MRSHMTRRTPTPMLSEGGTFSDTEKIDRFFRHPKLHIYPIDLYAKSSTYTPSPYHLSSTFSVLTQQSTLLINFLNLDVLRNILVLL